MTFDKHITSFAGLPIKDYRPGDPIPKENVALRVAVQYEDYGDDRKPLEATERFYTQFFESDDLKNISSLVLGLWTIYGEGTISYIVDMLVDHAAKLSNLKSLFLGDITFEECEISWLEMDDISKLWKAFPQLEIFWLRGSNGLSLGKIKHENLREFVLQSGGLPKTVLEEVLQSEMPNLEHLELWLGDENYGADSTIEDLKPLFTGSLFPKLKSLGLKNSQYSDDIAKALVESPILDRLETLDLSDGTLGDEGAEALCNSEKVGKLKKLILNHHYMSDKMMKRVSKLPCPTEVDEQLKEDEYGRYVAVGE